MKYPLRWYHRFFRELICYFFDHDWVCSKSVHSKWFGANYEDIPWGIRQGSSNCLWESLAWWSYKCQRCRMHLRENQWPRMKWYKVWYRAACQFMFDFRIAWGALLSNKRSSIFKLLNRVIFSIAFSFEQVWFSYFVHEFNWPSLPGEIAGLIAGKIYDHYDVTREGQPCGVANPFEAG